MVACCPPPWARHYRDRPPSAPDCRSPFRTTLNRVCGSGMKATMLAVHLLNAGSADIIVAEGMESMSNAPYLIDKARAAAIA